MLSSMTAFARQQSQGDWGTATWEIRTVNHRYLEIYFRLPDDLRNLEQQCREKISEYLSRGKVDVSLKFQPGSVVHPDINLNTNMLSALSRAAQSVEEFFPKIGSINPLHILQWPGVIQNSELPIDSLSEPILSALDNTLNELRSVRHREGASIATMLVDRLNQIQAHIDNVVQRVPEINQQLRTKLMAKLKDMNMVADHDRLEQEMVYYTQRIDVSEELDRLNTHIIECFRIINKGGAIGRRFDFLLQELNREANTLASKSVDTFQTHAAVDMKVLIEQLREQIQNLE